MLRFGSGMVTRWAALHGAWASRWWSERKNGLTLLSCSILIFAVNLFVCWRIFRFDYIGHMGSIEGSYYAISRHIIESWPDLSWWPAWYDGIPFSYSYPPVLHYLVALCAFVFSIPVARAHHLVTGFFYAFGPVTLFWLAFRLCRSLSGSFLAALAYSLVSPASFLVPSVLKDIGNPLLPRRLDTLVVYGDGPHIASLALVPLAVLLFDYALAKNRAPGYVAAALGFAIVTLTNWLGAVALALLLFAYLVASTDLERPAYSIRLWSKAFGLGILAYLFAAPLLTPSLIRTIQFNAQTVGGDYRSSGLNLRDKGPYLLAALFAVKALCHKTKVALYRQTFTLYLLLAGAICMSWEWFRIDLVPQPERYALDIDIGLVLLCVIPLAEHIDRLSRNWKVGCGAVLLILVISQVRLERKFAREVIQPLHISDTLEFKTASWFDRNVHGGRVMALGSQQFFLNAFGETPQHGGGFQQGNPGWENRVAEYILVSADGAGEHAAEVTLCWLKAFGIQAISVSGPRSKDAYPAFQRLSRFENIGTLAWQEGDDYIYKIPLRDGSLAHAVAPEDLVKNPPINGLDTGEMVKYVRAIDDRTLPDVNFRWTSQHSATMTARLNRDAVLATQISYFPGWRATVRGERCRTFRDGLGFLVVEPKCQGECSVDIVYDGGPEAKTAICASLIALLGSVFWMVGGAVYGRRRA